MIKPFFKYFLSLLFLTLLAACGDNNGDKGLLSSTGNGGNSHSSSSLTSIQLTPKFAQIPAGFTQDYTVTALFDDGHTEDITTNTVWTLSNSAIASMSTNIATGLVSGEVIITATVTVGDVTVKHDATLIVTDASITGLQVTPKSITTITGLEQQYMALAQLSDGSTKDVTHSKNIVWHSSNTNIANINSSGLASALAEGTTTITAELNLNGSSATDSAQLQVNAPSLVELLVTPKNSELPVGLALAYKAEAVFDNGQVFDVTNDHNLTWSSSDESKAIMGDVVFHAKNTKGAIGISVGTTTITAALNHNGTITEASTPLTVTPAVVVSLQLTPPSETIPAGRTQGFTAQAEMSDGSFLDITQDDALSWSSSDPDIATVLSSGPNKADATGVSTGEVTITASGSAHGTVFEATAALTVTEAEPMKLAIEVTNSNVIPIGLEEQMNATLTLTDNTTVDVTHDPNISWQSGSTAHATVSDSGLVKGIAVMENTPINASINYNGITVNSNTINVNIVDSIIQKITIDPLDSMIPNGLTQGFTATAHLSDNSTKDVTNSSLLSWSSDNTKIAAISNTVDYDKGIAYSLSTGTTKINAVYDSSSESGTNTIISADTAADLMVTDAIAISLEISDDASIEEKATHHFNAIILFSDGSIIDATDWDQLTWRSDNTNIATISNSGDTKGTATGIAVGSTLITASLQTSDGDILSDTSMLEVTTITPKPIRIYSDHPSWSDGKYQMQVASAINIALNVEYDDGHVTTITSEPDIWSSDSPNSSIKKSGPGGFNVLLAHIDYETVPHSVPVPPMETMTANVEIDGVPLSWDLEITFKKSRRDNAEHYCQRMDPDGVLGLPTSSQMAELFESLNSNETICSQYGLLLDGECGGDTDLYYTSSYGTYDLRKNIPVGSYTKSPEFVCLADPAFDGIR
ncbi:Ig-like domain-containing protein [Vibrio rumoiensis]|uniref:Ig-like domain-containing protein n=1 Tax=Vibrio rumoiensis TaxID=76258 RepID=UPI003AA94A3F